MSRSSTLPLQPPLLLSRNNPHGRKAHFIIGLNNNPIPFVENEGDASGPSTAAAAIVATATTGGRYSRESGGAVSLASSGWEMGADDEPALGRVDPALLARLRRNLFFSLPSAFSPSGQLSTDTVRTLDYFKSLKNVSKTFYSPTPGGSSFSGHLPEQTSWRGALGDFCRSLVEDLDSSKPVVQTAHEFGPDGSYLCFQIISLSFRVL